MREDARAKGRRYLAEGRLVIDHLSGDDVSATCRGAGELHSLGHSPSRGWWCSCAARSICSHLAALQLVTITRRREQGEGT